MNIWAGVSDGCSACPGEFMLAFQDPRQAVEWALMLQEALSK